MEFKFIPYALDKKDEPIGFFSNLSLLISDLQNLQSILGSTFTIDNLIVNIDATIGNDLDVGNDATVGGKLYATGGVVGDVYQPNGTTLALDNLTSTLGVAGSAVGTPLLYGRSIDSTTRTGVSVATAGSVNAAAAASLNGRFGYVGIQTYAINNSIFMENAWFDGQSSAFKYLGNGSAGRLYFLDGEINFDFAPSGSAGATAVFQKSVTIAGDGDIYTAKESILSSGTIAASDIKKGIVKVDVSLGSVLINLPTGSDLDVQFPKMDIGECYQFMLYPIGSLVDTVTLIDATGCVCQSGAATNGRRALYPRMVILRKIGTASYEIY